MAPSKERYIAYQETTGAQSRFQIGQDVVDRDGNWIGVVQARFSHYLLVDNGALLVKPYYIQHNLIEDSTKDNTLRLKVSEADLLSRGLDRVPDDLYEETRNLKCHRLRVCLCMHVGLYLLQKLDIITMALTFRVSTRMPLVHIALTKCVLYHRNMWPIVERSMPLVNRDLLQQQYRIKQ